MRLRGIFWKPGINGLGVFGFHCLPYRHKFDWAARAAKESAKEPTETPSEEPDGHTEDSTKPDGTEPDEDKPIQSSSIIDGSQIKLPKKKVARKPKKQ